MQVRVLLLLFEAGGLLGLQVLNKVLNGEALLLAAAETVEIKLLQLGRGVLTITLKNHPFPPVLAVLAGALLAVLVGLWVGRCVLAMSLVLYMEFK